MAHSVLFEDLPMPSRAAKAPNYRHAEIARILRSKPCEWARIQERTKRVDAATAAYQIRKGMLAAFRPAGAYEAKARTIDGRYYVYARYIGLAMECMPNELPADDIR